MASPALLEQVGFEPTTSIVEDVVSSAFSAVFWRGRRDACTTMLGGDNNEESSAQSGPCGSMLRGSDSNRLGSNVLSSAFASGIQLSKRRWHRAEPSRLSFRASDIAHDLSEPLTRRRLGGAAPWDSRGRVRTSICRVRIYRPTGWPTHEWLWRGRRGEESGRTRC